MRAMAVQSMSDEEREIPGYGVPKREKSSMGKEEPAKEKKQEEKQVEEQVKEKKQEKKQVEEPAKEKKQEKKQVRFSKGKGEPVKEKKQEETPEKKPVDLPKPRDKPKLQEGASGRAATVDRGKRYRNYSNQSHQESKKMVAINAGEFHGEAATLKYSKLLGIAPFSTKGVQYCPAYQIQGCSGDGRCSDPFCSLTHEVLPARCWPAEWQLLFLIQGGHKDWKGEIPWDSLASMLTERQRLQLLQMGEEAGRELLLYHLAKRLSHLAKATAEPTETDPIQQGETAHFRREIWGHQAATPFQVGSSSGITVEAVHRVLIGRCDALFNGLAFDAGEVIMGMGGLCNIKAMASGLGASPRWSPAAAGEGADVVLLREVVEELNHIPIEEVKPGSRLAQLYWSWSWLLTNGAPDDGLRLIDPPSLRRRNVFQIRDGPSGEPLQLHLSIVHGNAGAEGEMVWNKTNSAKLGQHKLAKEVIHAEVLALLISDHGSSRHSELFKLSKDVATVKSLLKKVGPMVRAGKAVLTISERGAPEHRAKMGLGKRHIRYVSQAMIEEASERIAEIHKRVGPLKDHQRQSETVEEVSGHVGKVVMAAVEAAEERAVQAEAELKKGESVKLSKGQLVAEWKAWHRERLPVDVTSKERPLTTQSDFFRMWDLHYKPFVAAVVKDDVNQPQRVLTYCGRFLNLWLRHGGGSTPRENLERMVTRLRSQYFGGRAGQGPQWEEVRDMLTGALSEGHVNLLQESIVRGADPVFLDLLHGQGMKIESHPSALLVENKVLWDQVEELSEMRALVFDVSESGMEKILMQAGIRISPIVTAPKTDAAGRFRLEEDGTVLQRVCVDCRETVNQGVFCGDHTAQKTTSPELVVQALLNEERKFPGHQMRMVKDDIVAAFRQVALRLHSVGLFASQATDFVCVNLTMIFGSGASPG